MHPIERISFSLPNPYDILESHRLAKFSVGNQRSGAAMGQALYLLKHAAANLDLDDNDTVEPEFTDLLIAIRSIQEIDERVSRRLDP